MGKLLLIIDIIKIGGKMKRLLFGFLILMMIGTNAYSADQWAKTQLDGGINISDIDLYNQANNEATDRLLFNYRRNLTVIPDTSSQVKVLAGEIGIQNSAGSIVKWRRNTSTTTVTFSDLDTGSEASSTQYYLYVLADTDAKTCTFKISTSSTSPDGATQYRKIGYFYNDSLSNIVNVGNIPSGGVQNRMNVEGSSDITTTSATYVDMNDMIIYYVSNGERAKVTFNSVIDTVGTGTQFALLIDVGGSTKKEIKGGGASQQDTPVTLIWEGVLTAGTHTIKIKWKRLSGSDTVTQPGADYSRTLFVE